MVPQDIQTDTPAARADRRQLTVMFCDLVESTEMSAQLDPEDMREVLLGYREVCAREVQALGGFVAQYLGDGILVYFGYPQARENDVENCLRAARAIIDGLAALSGPPMRARIGVATGMVVVGDVIAQHTQERDIAIGPTPNLAARLMGLSQPGEVVISDETYRLGPRHFDYDEMPDNAINGFDGLITAWRVKGVTQPGGGANAGRRRAHQTPLIGRSAEVQEIAGLWRKARRQGSSGTDHRRSRDQQIATGA